MDSYVSISDWAGLPRHLLDIVLEKTIQFSDYVRFSVVCVPWYCVAMDNRHKFAKKINSQVPMLLFPKIDAENGDLKNLYSITTKKLVNLELRIPCKTRYGGSSRGWLIFVSEDFVVTVIDPISPETFIKLPPILKNEMEYPFQVRKAILSDDPIIDPFNYEVAVIFGDQFQIAFIKPGQQSAKWIYVDHIVTLFIDIIYHGGRLHAVDFKGNIFCLDDNLSVLRKLSPPPNVFFHNGQAYLVESIGGHLLLVLRHIEYFDDGYRKTKNFEVYKHKLNSHGAIWVKLKSLGSEALFLGDNMSVSRLTSEIPGCCANSIYFTHDYDDVIGGGVRGPLDSGVFNLEYLSFAPHYVTDEASLIAMDEQPPIWYIPKFLSMGLKKTC